MEKEELEPKLRAGGKGVIVERPVCLVNHKVSSKWNEPQNHNRIGWFKTLNPPR